MTNNVNLAKEVQEARYAGLRALDSLRAAQKALESARGWGIFDILGGGTISTLVKHSKLDRAREHIENAQYALKKFRRELADVDLPDVWIDGLLTFADFIFDGFFADLLVQQRINEARRQIERTCRQVEDILRRLQ